MELRVYTDGGSRGNPGNAGIGVYIEDTSGNSVEKRYKNLGTKTNNEAEYLGAYYGIKRAGEIGAKKVHLYMDSSLVINQLKGEWKIKKDELREIHTDIKDIIKQKNLEVVFEWIPREKNKEADRLSNVAMDEK